MPGFAWIAAALAAGSLAGPARAAKFELAEEWPAVTFQDGDQGRTLFLHMADLDVPGFDLAGASSPAAGAGRGARLRARDLYVPLYELSVKDVHTKDDRPGGDVESLSLYSVATGYKLYLRIDKKGQHIIKRGPDFQTSAGQDLLGLLSVFHLHAARPRNILVMVRPGEAGVAQNDSLDDVELAAIASMDAAERAAAVEDCHGEPGSAAANPCWRAAARKLLSSHAQAKPNPEQELSPFEQRYLKRRLSAKGYAQYERAMELPAGHPDKMALLADWRESVLGLDVKEHLEVSGPPGTGTVAPPSQAPVTAPPAVPPSPVASTTTTQAPTAAAATPPSPAVGAPPSSKTRPGNASASQKASQPAPGLAQNGSAVQTAVLAAAAAMTQDGEALGKDLEALQTCRKSGRADCSALERQVKADQARLRTARADLRSAFKQKAVAAAVQAALVMMEQDSTALDTDLAALKTCRKKRGADCSAAEERLKDDQARLKADLDAVSQAVMAEGRPAPPVEKTPIPPRKLPFRRVLLGFIIIFVVIFVLFRRKRGR
jgi:hypothetical protein